MTNKDRKEWRKVRKAIRNGTGNIVEIRGPGGIERLIGEMASGEVGYTMPWAVEDGELAENYPVYAQAEGTVQLKIKCVGAHKYVVGTGPRR